MRVDSAGFYDGLKPNQMYDPLVGKLICSGPTWDEANQLERGELKGLANQTRKKSGEFPLLQGEYTTLIFAHF